MLLCGARKRAILTGELDRRREILASKVNELRCLSLRTRSMSNCLDVERGPSLSCAGS